MRKIRQYHLPTLKFYQLTGIILLLGFVTGIILAYRLQKVYFLEINQFFEQIKSNLAGAKIDWLLLFEEILKKRLQGFGLMLLFLISVLWIPYMGGFLLYKGLLSGFLFANALGCFGRKGIMLAVALFFPQSFFYVPSWYMILNKGWKTGRKIESHKNLWQELPCLFFSLALLIVGCISEAFINTWILQQIFSVL